MRIGLTPPHKSLQIGGGIAILICWFWTLASKNRLDLDEGVFTLAPHLVLAGKMPYRDFTYHQMPYMPYFTAAWLEIFGQGWYSARAFSCFLTVLLSLALFRHLLWRHNARVATTGTILLAFSSLVMRWCTILKSYTIAMLPAFLAWELVERYARNGSKQGRSALMLAGFLLAVACANRLLFLVLGLPFFLQFLQAPLTLRRRLQDTLTFSAGLLVGFIPVAWFYVSSPKGFMFGNLGLHAIRSNYGWQENLLSKIQVTLQLLAMQYGYSDIGVQSLLTLIVCSGAAAWWTVHKQKPSFAFQCAGVLLVANLVPSPPYTQYFVILMPFLIVVVLDVAVASERKLTSHLSCMILQQQVQSWIRKVQIVSLLTWCVLGALDIPDIVGAYAPWYRLADKQAIESTALSDSIWTARQASALLDDLTDPGEEVFTTWPGYILESHARLVHGLECYAAPVKPRETRADLDSVGLMSQSRAEAIVQGHTVKVILLGYNRDYWNLGKLVESSGYRRVGRIHDVDIFRFYGPMP